MSECNAEPDCHRPAHARGWCRMHHKRWLRYGNPLTVRPKGFPPADPRARLESHIDRSDGPDACHPWTAGQHADGYGWIRIGGQPKLAHIALWELENGTKPLGTELDHECHNQAVREGTCNPGKCPHRLCCNLAHIVLRVSRKAHRAATMQWEQTKREGNAKLTQDQVREIRELLKEGKPLSGIARNYDVKRRTVYRIKTGESWWWLD